MAAIPQLKTNSFWSKLYQPSTVSSINALLPQNPQLDKLTQSFKVLKNFTVEDAKTQEQYRKNIAAFSDSVKEINSSVKDLTSSNTFANKAVTGSTNNAVTGVAKTAAKETQYNVNVNAVAKTQKNESTKLKSNEYGALASGSYTFALKTASGIEKQLSVNIKAIDNNKQVLTKFANAINNSGAGITAEIKTKDNTQYLSVASKDTGAANAFSINDITGNAIAGLQLDKATEKAADAKYTVDGTSYTTASNKVSLDNGNVTLQLNKTTNGTTKITVGKDSTSIVAGAKSLVQSYNDLHDVLSNSENVTKRGSTVLNALEATMSGARASDFANIGISISASTGELKLNEKKLTAAIENNPDKVKQLFSGGLVKGMEAISKELSNNPVTNYLKAPGTNSDYGSQFASNSWMAQQNYLIQGLFFDMTV